MSNLLPAIRHNIGELLFERRYGTQTNGRWNFDEFNVAGDERVYYIASNWLTLRRVLSQRDVSTDDVFLDLGAGMGRMVLEAARYRFRRVIGVEPVTELCDIARANVAKTRQRLRCRDIELVCSDVLEYQIPRDVTVVFLNNPFRGQIFAQVIDGLLTSVDDNPRRVRIIYANPVEDQTLLDTGRFIRQSTTALVPFRRPKPTFGSTSIYSIIPRPGAN